MIFRRALVIALGAAFPAASGAATPGDSAITVMSDPFAPVQSMGLPIRRAPYAGASFVSERLDDGYASHPQAFFGYRRDIIMPALGVLGVGFEGYAGPADGEALYGGRALLSVRALRLKTGLDFSSRETGGEWILTLEDPILRGGFPLRGSTTRLEWIPARGHVGLGLSVPLFQPWIGQTRPRKIRVELEDLPEAARTPHAPSKSPSKHQTEPSDAKLADSAEWIDFLTTPHDPDQLKTNEEWMRFVERVRTKLAQRDADHPDGRSPPQEIAFYHGRLLSLFREALDLGAAGADAVVATSTADVPGPASEDVSGEVCDMARRVTLDRLVAPYNAEFGRLRDDRIFDALAGSARRGFEAWCDTAAVVPSASRERVLAVFDRWLAVLRTVQRKAHERWDDTRKIWLSFDLVLRPDEHDSQLEIDAILERLLGGRFQGGNTYRYLVNEAFSPALIQSLHEANEYHVLWIHDFPGRDPDGNVDSVGCMVVTAGYLDALTRAVRRLDSGGSLPAFVVLLDQWYFDGRKGHWWMSVLENPLGASCRLPESAPSQREAVLAAQARLRAAVDSSRALTKLRKERGDGWLRRYVRVHVNVTFPGDPSFAGRAPVPTFLLKFSDDYMRDHSKLVFWDLTEEDPSRGAALVTGEGVGENYEGSRWEDRTLLLRGPGALELKQRARELLASQGLRPDQIPLPLHERAKAPDWDARVDSLIAAGNTVRVMQAHNGTGYQRKSASTLKAAIYNLMPAGSRMLIPDSQWTSYYWAGMLVGAALRGAHVFVVAARSSNAPYGNAMVQNVLTHDVLEGYVQLRSVFADAFAASGGALQVGIYGEGIGTRSLVNRYRSVLAGMQRDRFPRSAFPFSPATYAALGDSARLIRMMRPLFALPSLPEIDARHHPKLHLKSQFFASGPGLSRAMGAAGWDSVFALYVGERIRSTFADPRQAGTGDMSPSLLAPIRGALFEAAPESTAADVFYLTIGSHNQNDRSLLLDGEVLCVLSGPESLAPIIDFAAIAARSEWIETPEEVDRAIPRHGRRDVKLARRLRSLF